MADNWNFSFSMRKAILADPYVLIKKVSKIAKFNKSKEYLSYPENKSKPPTQKVPLPNYSTKWSHGENLEKQKWSFSLHKREKTKSKRKLLHYNLKKKFNFLQKVQVILVLNLTSLLYGLIMFCLKRDLNAPEVWFRSSVRRRKFYVIM